MPRGFGSWFSRQLEREDEARSAFFLLPAGMMLGIASIQATGYRPPATLVFALAVLTSLAALRSTRAVLLILCLVSAALFGAALSVVELDRSRAVLFSGEATVGVEGRVLWKDRDERGRYRYLVALERTERPTLSRPPRRVEILVSSKHEPLSIGQQYRGLVRLRPPSGPALPGGYDFAFGAFFNQLGAYGFALGAPAPTLGEEKPSLTLPERLTDLRLLISDRIRSVIAGGEGAVAAAIITGERTGIPNDIEEWLRLTGLSHVLSISGVHMALAAGFAMVLVRGFCAFVPAIALRWPSKKIAAFAALAVSAAYLALSGADVAATRSFIMIAIMLTAVLFDRSAVTLRNVAIAAVIVLAAMPHALFTASFQMSFAATAAIVALYATFGHRLSPARRGERHGLIKVATLWLVGIAVSSTVAGVATAPYAAFHFQRIAPFGLAANMLALPIFSFWIMPLALLAMLAMPFGLDAPLLWLLGQGLTLVFFVARTLAAYMPDSPTGLLPVPALVAITLAILAACFLSSGLRLIAIPIALIGVVLTLDRTEVPEVLVFENGREAAVFDEFGRIATVRARPNRFVLDQWKRAYPERSADGSKASTTFACDTVQDEATVDQAGGGEATPAGAVPKKPRSYQFCRATTRSGIRVVWTDDYRLLGKACDEADLAIVARAVRRTECRSSATLLTLRTLRATGSVSAIRTSGGQLVLRSSIGNPNEEWNVHREAPWPERWRRDRSSEIEPSGKSDTIVEP